MPLTNQSTLTTQLTTIESLTGTNTDILSITYPPAKSIADLRTRLENEYAQAEHIQSDTTRKHVQKAIKKALRITRQYQHTPDTGLAIFTGVIDSELHAYVFDSTVLPAPIQATTYTCDSAFHTTPVRDVITTGDTYALIVIERGNAIIGELRGEQLITHHEVESHVMGKSRAGGQSAQRFARDRERQLNDFFQDTARILTDKFVTDGDCSVDGVVVGGSLGTAKRFVRDDVLDHRLRDSVVGVYSVEYATLQGLRQLVKQARESLTESSHARVFDVLDQFKSELATGGESVTYGYDHVQTACEYNAVETLLISDCYTDTHTDIMTDVADCGGDVVVVPTGTDRGETFTQAFNGIAAVLRFPIE